MPLIPFSANSTLKTISTGSSVVTTFSQMQSEEMSWMDVFMPSTGDQIIELASSNNPNAGDRIALRAGQSARLYGSDADEFYYRKHSGTGSATFYVVITNENR